MPGSCAWRLGGSSLRMYTSATWMGMGWWAWRGTGQATGPGTGLWGSRHGREPLSISFCRKEILQDVSFSVMPGQTLALVRVEPWVWAYR